MRVALLSFDFPQYCIRLANGLAEAAEVLLLLPEDESRPYRFGLDPRVQTVDLRPGRLRQPLVQGRMVRSALEQIRAFNPDVIHYQAGHMWFNLVWPFYRDYPLVVTIHETRHHAGDRDSSKTPQWIKDLGYRRADRIIVHGEWLRGSVVADLHRPREIIDIVPAVPDIVLGNGDPGHAVDGDGRSVLFFGRIWPYKGLEYLIRAEPLVSERIPDARFVIAGRGESLTRYRRMMVNPDRFEIHNDYIPDEQMIELFSRAALVALPYVGGSISGVVPVACTFGKPIVATTAGILPEMIENGRSGLIVPPRDEVALAGAIAEVLSDPALRGELAANARRRAETVFNPINVAAETIEVYERAIAGRRQ